MSDKPTVYQEAVEFRSKVESGEFNAKGYVSIPSFLGLLGYMEQEHESITSNAVKLLSGQVCDVHSEKIKARSFLDFKIMDDAVGCRYCLKKERDILFDAHSKEMVRADIAEGKLTDVISQRECYQRGFSAGTKETLSNPIFKDHQIAQLVNDLTNTAKEYADTEQLREHISKVVVSAVKP